MSIFYDYTSHPLELCKVGYVIRREHDYWLIVLK